MARNINFVVKTSLFHVYKFGYLWWCGAVTQAQACARLRRVKSERDSELLLINHIHINHLFQATESIRNLTFFYEFKKKDYPSIIKNRNNNFFSKNCYGFSF